MRFQHEARDAQNARTDFLRTSRQRECEVVARSTEDHCDHVALEQALALEIAEHELQLGVLVGQIHELDVVVLHESDLRRAGFALRRLLHAMPNADDSSHVGHSFPALWAIN